MRLTSLLLMAGIAVPAGAQRLAVPDPSLNPAQAVSLQLAALGANDTPVADAGIATAFAFASPRNRAATGPLDRFARMIHDQYAALLDFRSVEVGTPHGQGGEALVPVELVSTDGRVVLYVFLMRQYATDECSGCWLTDAVFDSPQNSGPLPET